MQKPRIRTATGLILATESTDQQEIEGQLCMGFVRANDVQGRLLLVPTNSLELVEFPLERDDCEVPS